MGMPIYEYETTFKSDYFKDIPTCALVEELQRREGVQAYAAGPDASVELKQTGPAIVLVVID